jgi:hypothetical protein
LKSYYNALIATLSTAKPSVRWTLVLISQLPLILMAAYFWVFLTSATRTVGAFQLFSQLVEATGGSSEKVREAAELAFATSASGQVMIAALCFSVAVGAAFFNVALKAGDARKAAERNA